MFLLNDIEKLINEHGSSSILRDRLCLIQDKAAEFERKFKLLEAEAIILRKELTEQKADKARLEAESLDLKERLNVYEQPKHSNPTDEQMDILKLLINSTLRVEQITVQINRVVAAIRLDLEDLTDAGLIEIEHSLGFEFVSLTRKGRIYLKGLGII